MALGEKRMRRLLAILAGGFIAALPMLFLAWPDYAYLAACHRFEETTLAVPDRAEASRTDAVVESPCFIGESWEPDSTALALAALAALIVACVLGGRLAATISENGNKFVASAAGALPYVTLSLLDRAFVVGLLLGVLAGLFGLLGVVRWSWIAHLTNGWRATRPKPRAPQP
jgi:hypothetical protein